MRYINRLFTFTFRLHRNPGFFPACRPTQRDGAYQLATAHRTLEARYSVVWVKIRPVFVAVAPGCRS